MKKSLVILLALVACRKTANNVVYKGDLINIQIESNASTLYVNNVAYASNINKLDTNIWLFASDTIRIVNSSIEGEQHIKCVVNFNKLYSATYRNNKVYDSTKACPSRSRIEYKNNTLMFMIIYRYLS
jgi:hypothetical protein